MSTSSTDPADRPPLPPPVVSSSSSSGVAAPPTPDPTRDPTADPTSTSADDRDPDPASAPALASGARPGGLTPSWRFLLGAAWALAFFAYAAIWNASVQIGIGTWWIGPRGQPTHIVVRLLPFLLCLAVLICIIYNVGSVVRTSAIATGLAAVGAIPDFSRSVGLGVAEMLVAGLLAIVTLTALTGRYRLRPAGAAAVDIESRDRPAESAEPSIEFPPLSD